MPEHNSPEQLNEVPGTSPSKEEFKISFDKSSNKSDSSSDEVDIVTHQDDDLSDNRDQIGTSSMGSVRSARRSNRKAIAEMELYSQEMPLGAPNMDVSLEQELLLPAASQAEERKSEKQVTNTNITYEDNEDDDLE